MSHYDRKMHIKTVQYDHVSIGKAEIKSTMLVRVEERELSDCWRECRMVQLLWKIVGHLLKGTYHEKRKHKSICRLVYEC